jgi:hypothetical protein
MNTCLFIYANIALQHLQVLNIQLGKLSLTIQKPQHIEP